MATADCDEPLTSGDAGEEFAATDKFRPARLGEGAQRMSLTEGGGMSYHLGRPTTRPRIAVERDAGRGEMREHRPLGSVIPGTHVMPGGLEVDGEGTNPHAAGA
jgi:hypothetical protein